MHAEILVDTKLESWDCSESASGRNPVLLPKCTGMDSEKDLINAFETVVHSDFPNPQRTGCPDRGSLVRLASTSGILEFGAILEHIRRCAPCFDELKQLREAESKSRA
jgi:hypothetical protein